MPPSATDAWDSWDNIASDPIADIQQFFKMVENERWICKTCAWTTRYPPQYPNPHKCPACGQSNWHYTTRDPEEF
jgi:rubrerythrin